MIYHIKANVRSKNMARNMVNTEISEVKTTSCPASFPSPPISWAMVKELTATGDAKTAMTITRELPRNPMKMAASKKTAGKTIS